MAGMAVDLSRGGSAMTGRVTGGDEICAMDANAIAAAIRERRLGPVEVVEAVLERMDQLEPSLRAFCTPTPDLARAAARRVEAQLAAGEAVGPLAGVPIS